MIKYCLYCKEKIRKGHKTSAQYVIAKYCSHSCAGKANLPKSPFRNTEEHFWELVDKTDTCWNWLGPISTRGYGTYTDNGYIIGAHRFSYRLIKGELIKGLQIDHLCRNRICVNPSHLDQVTCKENLHRIPNFGANRTHCLRGHPFLVENTSIRADGTGRLCRKCCRIRQMSYAKKKRLLEQVE